MTGSPADGSAGSGLPTLWAGSRRRYLSLLVLSGLGQAAAAGLGAQLLSKVLSGSATSRRPTIFALLVVAAVVIGALRMAERILAERLSQDYVQEVRLGLLRRNLADGKVQSLGIAVARTTNDLTSVKNWVSQGVAPLAVGVPLIIGASVALVWLEPLFAIALVVPIAAFLAAMGTLAPVAYRRSRKLRRERGRLSSQVADTILSTPAIRSAGGSDRELRRIAGLSNGVVAAAIDRAKIAGALRGAAATTSAVATAMVVGIGLLSGLPTHSVAGALAIVGFLSTPLNDLGRVAEYRQTFRAARRIIGPAFAPPVAGAEAPVALPAVPAVETDVGVTTSDFTLSDGRVMPELRARPGDRIVMDSGVKAMTSQGLLRFVGLDAAHEGEVLVDGRDLSDVGPKELRSLVGYARQGMMLVRGTVSRNVRYRSPEASAEQVDQALATVGLSQRVAEFADGVDTRLVHGGEPLTVSERARLLLARAILDDPPLLVLDDLDADLGADGRDMLSDLLRSYPGVVLLTRDDPDLVEATQVWRPLLPRPASPEAARQG